MGVAKWFAFRAHAPDHGDPAEPGHRGTKGQGGFGWSGWTIWLWVENREIPKWVALENANKTKSCGPYPGGLLFLSQLANCQQLRYDNGIAKGVAKKLDRQPQMNKQLVDY